MKIKIYHCLLITFFLVSSTCFSQLQQSYLFQKEKLNGKINYHLFEKDTLTISPFISKGGGVKECTVITGSGKYTARLVNKKHSYQILDEQGNLLATLGFGNKLFMDITFPDGEVYDHQLNGSKKNWKFVHKGATVLECGYIKRNGKKYLDYFIKQDDPAKMEIVKIASQIRGVDLIRANAQKPVWISMVIATGVLTSVASAQSSPSGY